MTEPESLIVLYSKYSRACNDVLELYNQAPVEFMKFICVDNVTTRQRLLSSKRLRITSVPCVLLVYPDGTMEKFEEGDVSGWLQSQIAKYLPEEQTTPIQSQEQVTVLEEEQPQQQEQVMPLEQEPQQTMIEELAPSMTQESSTKKSISEIAAEMAAARDGDDIPMQQKKIRMQQQGLSQIP